MSSISLLSGWLPPLCRVHSGNIDWPLPSRAGAHFYLPSYSPDLNPDEYLNNDLKGEVSRRADSRQKGRLGKSALSAMRRIQKKPARVRKYFQAEPIRYAL